MNADLPVCTGTTQEGRPCRKPALHGSEFCAIHGPGGAPVGRPTLLTEAISARIVAVMRAGGYPDVAAQVAGVSRKTFGIWLKRGEPTGTDPDDAPFRRLREAVEAAQAEGEARNVAIIARAAMENWQAAAWLLERQHPERWARISQRPVEEPAAPGPSDPFAEVDELAARRRTS
jgi:transposase